MHQSASAAKILTFDCEVPTYKPDGLASSCADGGTGITRIVWSSWGGKTAMGTGYEYKNLCNGSMGCANGKIVYKKVSLTLNHIKKIKGEL